MNTAPVLPSTPLQARCAFHPEHDAIAACGRCGTFTCMACQQVATDGRSYCFRCLAAPAPLATRGARFAANLIDNGVWLTFLVAAAIAASVAPDDDGAMAIGLGVAVLIVLAFYGTQLFLQISNGQSLGKRLLKIKVVRMDGSPVSLGRLIFLRNVVPTIFSSLCNGIFGLVDSLFIMGEQCRCVHDHLADTKVIRVDEEAR